MEREYLPVIILGLQIFLLLAVPLFLGRALVQILSDRTDVPFVRTPRRVFKTIADALDIQAFDVVYELGSGDGSFLLWCAKEYPQAKFVGIERNPLLDRYVRWRVKHSELRNLSFIRGDIFTENLSGARKIYAYLLNPVMDRLLPKLQREFHGRLASRAFIFKDKQSVRTIELSKKPGSHGQHLLYVYDF